MKRRTFLKTVGTASVAAGAAAGNLQAFEPVHNWDRYDFGGGPPVKDRLYQRPFPQYPPELVAPGSSVVMTTRPSEKIIQNYGMGLIVYVSGDMKKKGIRDW